MSMKNSLYYRKRTLSTDSVEATDSKRLRRLSTQTIGDDASFSMPSPGSSRVGSTMDAPFLDELSRRVQRTPTRPRISTSSSFPRSAPLSRASSMDSEGFHALIRSASVVSDGRRKRDSMAPGEMYTFKEHSAFHNVKSVNSIDYSAPSTGDAATDNPAAPPIGWSHSNALVFGRGNRVYHKTMADTEGVAQQLTKLTSGMGILRLVHCAGVDQPNTVTLAMSGGLMQIWDISARQSVREWKVKGPSAMAFNGALLTVGDEKGALRHYDTRVSETAKMKDQAKKVTRHQGRITALAWSRDGNFVASGDQNGVILMWDIRKPRVPVEVGEMVQRRRKMQHVGAITALAWCPWFGKYLVSGDSAPDCTGTIRIWDMSFDGDSSAKYPERPTKLELDAQVTSLHFSPQINELLSTHGAGRITEVPSLFNAEPLHARMRNSIAVHQFPSMRHVTTAPVAQKGVAGSVLSPNGQRIVLAVPEEAQLKVWDVWGKFREAKQKSLLETCIIR
ncbi:WD40-repeat-containing domain protein [Daedaleopsis nitida]|nr:WD40-repeat-containing domain protein [Daedaleopsis nitida]